MRPRPQFGHPLAQCRDDNLATDDHRRRQGQPEVRMHLHQQHQGHRNHQLVSHRVQEGTEWRALLQATGQVTVKPIGGCGNGKDAARCDIAPVIRNIKQQNEERDEQDAKNCK
ncbi:hypothetical protein D3C78_1487570 [compost metagenome]